MRRNRFVATRLTSAEASDLWSRSDQASAFTRPDYLEQLVDEVEWWGADRSGEVVAAWPLVRAVAGGEIGPPPFCYYVGPMFARSLSEDKYLRYWTSYTNSLSVLADTLARTHARFRFSLPVGLVDVRPLEWWNFDHPGQPHFDVAPRFTARIDLSEFPDDAALYESFARDRRRHVKRWTQTPTTMVEHVPTQRVIELHDGALRRSGAAIHPDRHTALRRILRLVENGAGVTVGVVPPGATEIEAAIVLLHGPDESNNVLCVASDAWREEGLTAWVVWQGLLRARSLGKRWFDFNGANSPGRAADKHFYGARAEMYFNCSFGAK